MRVGCFKRTALKHVYYQGWNRSPAQVGCMRWALGPGALGGPGGSGWRRRWEGGSGWGRHVNSRTFHFNVWQNSLQIKKKKRILEWLSFPSPGDLPNPGIKPGSPALQVGSLPSEATGKPGVGDTSLHLAQRTTSHPWRKIALGRLQSLIKNLKLHRGAQTRISSQRGSRACAREY